MSYAEIERKFGVDELTQRAWVRNPHKEDKRRTQSGRKPVLDELEVKLRDNLLKMRDNGTPVDSKLILKEMQSLYQENYKISAEDFNFLQRFARYCSSKDLKINYVLKLKSTEDVPCYDTSNEEYLLSNNEKILLRDLLLQVEER